MLRLRLLSLLAALALAAPLAAAPLAGCDGAEPGHEAADRERGEQGAGAGARTGRSG